jgi:hypothetical protein
LSGRESSCWLVSERGEYDLQLFTDGKLLFGYRLPDRRSALTFAEALRGDLAIRRASLTRLAHDIGC